MVSLGLAWVSISFSVSVMGYTYSFGTMSASGTSVLQSGGEGLGMGALVLVGGILALVGGISMLGAEMKGLNHLLPIGGLLALLGGIWAAARVVQISGAISSLSSVIGSGGASVGYGIFVGIIGGILALIGSLGLRSYPNPPITPFENLPKEIESNSVKYHIKEKKSQSEHPKASSRVKVFAKTQSALEPTGFCENCGTPIEKGDKFCGKCGLKI